MIRGVGFRGATVDPAEGVLRRGATECLREDWSPVGHAALSAESPALARRGKTGAADSRGGHHTTDFILGLPRSGTTFLHNLLAHDEANRVPRCWQTVYPYPEAGRRVSGDDSRAHDVARKFNSFLAMVPELRSLHPLDAFAAQECIEITGQVLRSLRFDTTHYVPSYAAWLEQVGHLEAYRFHKRFLQDLQHQAGAGCWILKTPDHIFAIGALRAVYPDSRFIFVHRDPMEVLPSVARLTEILRQPFTQSVGRLQIGRQVNESWIIGSRR
jgi:hypothetical protein